MERPTRTTAEMMQAAAESTVADLCRWGVPDGYSVAQMVADIVRVGRPHMSGYELAKELDDRCHWDIDDDMVETLAGFDGYLDGLLRAAEKAWFASNPIEPPVPVGARVRLSRGRVGTITGIYEYGPAKFLVAVDGDPHCAPEKTGREIVNFEDVSALEPATHAVLKGA